MPRGGRRPGAGTKPKFFSEKLKKKMSAAIKRAAKESGRTPEDILAEILTQGTFLGSKVETKDWNVAFRIYVDSFLIKDSHKQVEVDIRDNRVAVYLPELKKPDLQEIPKS